MFALLKCLCTLCIICILYFGTQYPQKIVLLNFRVYCFSIYVYIIKHRLYKSDNKEIIENHKKILAVFNYEIKVETVCLCAYILLCLRICIE